MMKGNSRYRTGAVLLAAALMTGLLASCGPQTTESGGMAVDTWSCEYEIPTAESLLNKGDKQNRYLSLPGSRLVINPFNFESQARETTQSQYSNRSSMPMNFGFCDPFKGESRGIELPNVVMMAEKTGEGDAAVERLWEADLSSSAGWGFGSLDTSQCVAEFHGDSASITVGEKYEFAWQHMESTVTANVDNAFLTITVEEISQTSGLVGVKVNGGTVDDLMLMQTGSTGIYTFNLAEATGWSGTKTFKVKVFSVGYGNTVTFSNLKIQRGERVYSGASEYTTSWRPDRLDFDASYASGMEMTGTDFFYDEKTVVRTLSLTGGKGIMVYGEYSGRAVAEGATVLVDRGNLKYAVTASGNVQPRFFSGVVETLAGEEGSDQPSGADYGVWAFVLEEPPENGEWRIAVSFDTKEAADADVMSLSQKPGDDCADRLAQRTQQWDELLTRVPRPGTFELTDIDTKGVTADQVRQSYYEAWVQIISNVLPPNPEVDFPYPIMATGKASLWGYGSPKCSYAATWDALYGISAYSQIDPDAAWEMYKGLMSLVGEDGQIAGESLPPNNAKVAWILYTAKPDKAALEEIQPALERHLTWRFNNPRWIYMDYTPDVFQKDCDFVASSLVDVRYLMRINEELGLEKENDKWVQRSSQLYKNMKLWFFSDVTEYPVEYFSLSDNSRAQGNASWVTKTLYVPELKEEERDDLLRLFRSLYDVSKPFCGMSPVKYEEYNYTLLGLMQHGYTQEARNMIQAAVRDITLSGIHAEGYAYQSTDTFPLPDGVRPSLFGVNMLIDCVYMLNGVRMDDGMPVLSNYFDTPGGMENLKVDGKTFHFHKEGGTYTYGGSYTGEEKTMEVEAGHLGFPFEGTNVYPLQGAETNA